MLQSVRNYVEYERHPVFYQAMILLLEQKVREGKIGAQSKSGFYGYPLKKDEYIPAKSTELLQKITHWYLDNVFEIFQKSICNKAELEHIVREYMSIEKSPFELAEEISYNPK